MNPVRNLKDFDLKNKRVLLRCDFQVPLSPKGDILDDFKVKATIPTIEYLKKEGAKTILISHLKPMESGKEAQSLKLVQPRIEELLGYKIHFLGDFWKEEVGGKIEEMNSGEIALLENLRFHKEEEENNEEFAKKLASLGDIYINDAFSVCHRPHASVIGVPNYLSSGTGLLLEKEIKILENLMKNPEKPLVVIIGGAKVKTKTGMIEKFIKNADFILIGELIEKEIKKEGLKFSSPEKIIGIVDSVETFDLGPKTIQLFKEKIKKARTVFWSGPLGKVEDEKFSWGTKEVAQAIIQSGAFSVAGGGETVEFINKLGLADKFNHVSTGGGAMLHFLAGEKLPGIEVLRSAS